MKDQYRFWRTIIKKNSLSSAQWLRIKRVAYAHQQRLAVVVVAVTITGCKAVGQPCDSYQTKLHR
jgi:hypothetical protein